MNSWGITYEAALKHTNDERQPPDEGRRRQFKRGWSDFANRNQRYTADTLAALTWTNLGYRFAQDLQTSPAEDIDEVWAVVADWYLIERGLK